MRLALAATLAVVALAAGCAAGSPRASEATPQLTVAAASSLTEALGRYERSFSPARVRLSFGGSDELAAQVRRGARPDVYAAANTELPERLFAEGLLERPAVFATNRLVLAVRARSAVDSPADLERPGVDLVVGSPSVPVGSYTRAVVGRLGRGRAARVLANVRSEEPDVKGVVAKVARGAADAGFVYRTDVVAARGALRAIELPARLGPRVAYGVGVVRRSERPREARAFVAGLLSGRGADALREAGFGPPPAR